MLYAGVRVWTGAAGTDDKVMVYIKDNKEANVHDGTPHVSVLYRRKSATATWHVKQSGSIKPGCGGCLAFVRFTTRTEGPHGGASHVRCPTAKRNRIARNPPMDD